MIFVAAFAGVVLIGSIAWKTFGPQPALIVAHAPSSASTSTPQIVRGGDSLQNLRSSSSTGALTPLGATVFGKLASTYSDMQQKGTYTADAGASAANTIASTLNPTVVYHIFTAPELTIDSDTSKARTMVYRSTLRDSLSPLLKNADFELDTFGKFVETKDPKYLDDLRAAADNYRMAIAATAKVSVPGDAIAQHLSMLNALSKFTSVLDALIQNAHDPFATAVTLKAFVAAEGDMVLAFDGIGRYAAQKLL